MIDLHCHILPGVDDGASDIAESLAMARLAVEDGIRIAACTPHIYPGLYDNTGRSIRAAVAVLSAALEEAEIELHLVAGADVHMAPGLVAGLDTGRVLTLNGSRYLLFEPPHHVAPPRLEETLFELLAAGYVPVLTHPERLSWIESHYALVRRLAAAGVWMQVTAGSLTGCFGRGARYWAERLLDDGLVQLLCSDAHDSRHRAPRLGEALAFVAARRGGDEAERLAWTRPAAVLRDLPPAEIAAGGDGPASRGRPVGLMAM